MRRELRPGHGGVPLPLHDTKLRIALTNSCASSICGVEPGGRGIWSVSCCSTRAQVDAKAMCDMLRPPGRKVYQRGSYTIWEVDGAQSPVSCLPCLNLQLTVAVLSEFELVWQAVHRSQGLSPTRRLASNSSQSVFYHVENFLFYVIADASTSRHDQVMAFFSKVRGRLLHVLSSRCPSFLPSSTSSATKNVNPFIQHPSSDTFHSISALLL